MNLRQEVQEDKMRIERKIAKQERALNMTKEMQDREIEETKEENHKISERLRIVEQNQERNTPTKSSSTECCV